MEQKADIPSIYLFIYGLIRQNSLDMTRVTHPEVLEILRRRLHKIPRILHYEFIREMESYGLIKKINKSFYQITGGKRDQSLRQIAPFLSI